jgi:putative nucleotidyltransferase with HDIG domain
MLRAAQFAARFAFAIEPQTFVLMRECAPMIHAEPPVAAERIAEELNKLLVKSARPSIGLRILRDAGLLALVIPGLETTTGVMQNNFHAHDVFDHTMATVDASRPTLVSRWAALLHDIGKPAARSAEPAKHGYTFHGHERIGAEMAERILRHLRYPNEMIDQVTRLVANHMYLADPGLSEGAIKRFINRVGPDLLDDQFELRRSDKIGSGKPQDETLDANRQFQQRVYGVLAQKPPLTVKDLAVHGADVIAMLVKCGARPAGFHGGPEVGRILGALQEKVIDDPGLNTREQLLREIELMAGSPLA